MKFLFFGKKSTKTILAEKAKDNAIIHSNNIQNIVKSREPAESLKRVLKQNHIIIQIAGAVGGK